MNAPPVAIVGCGRTGGSIGLALKRAGYAIAAVWSPTLEGRERARSLLGVPVPDELADVVTAADLLLLAVPDDALEKVAIQVAPWSRGRLVAHTSGATSVDVLSAVREAGGRTACVHPLQTLPDPLSGAIALMGAPVAVTAGDDDQDVLFGLARAWGGEPFALADEAKPLYHAAAVFASNYVGASVAAAVDLLEQAGVGDPRDVLRALVEASAANAVRTGAITGPAVRGDVGTIVRHAELLRDTSYAEAYGALAVLAARLGGGDPDAIQEAVR